MRHTIHASAVAGLIGLAALAGPAPRAQTAPADPAPSALPAARAFYAPAAIEDLALSPSGRWLALKTGSSGRAGLVLFDLQTWQAVSMLVRYADADVGDFAWVGDEHIVYDIEDRERGGGDQRWWPGLFSVRRDGTGSRQLIKLAQPFLSGARTVGREPLEPWHDWLATLGDGSTDVIVGRVEWNGADEFQGLVPKRLDITTGRDRSLAFGAPPNVKQWLFDARGEPRLAVTTTSGRTTYHWRTLPGGEWRPIGEFPTLSRPYTPRFVDTEGQLFVTTPGGTDGTAQLRRFDFATGRPEPAPLVSTPGFDFSGHIVSETPGSRALGVRVLTDAETTVWFDPVMAALQKAADDRLPGHINRITCRRCGQKDMVAIVRAFNDRDPGQFWHHDAATGAWRKLGNVRPDIDPRQMGATRFERIRARDGLELPLWITEPAAARAKAGPRPAVLLVHGGPWVRGRSWKWDADAQFLASRGYVVLEPEFRGSRGYGARLYRAGYRQWGQAMQDDLIDSLDWAIAQGLVDPKRVCIAGASYGGYATLMGLVRHGDRLRCGAAWVAVSDPRLLFRWRYGTDVSTESREHLLPELIGDPVRDAAMLDAHTPVLLASKIERPLLLAYGAQDRRVPRLHGERMRDALVAAGRPPEWVMYGDEGHGWFKLETRLDFAARLEAFLARHLKP